MPLVLQKNIETFAILAIWEIEETSAQLLEGLHHFYFEKDHEKRSRQVNALHYLASRRILTTLFPNQQIHLYKNEFNKPFLKIDGKDFHLSITHSHQFAGIIISESNEVALDIEKIDSRIGRVKHKFLNNEEFLFAGNEQQIGTQTLIWSAKETMYKLYGLKELDFKKNLHILPFEIGSEGKITGMLTKDVYTKMIPVSYFTINEFIISYTIELQS